MNFSGFIKGIIISIILLALLYQACKRHDESKQILLQAELLMKENPDSSLWLLENVVTTSRLSKEQYAEWCLLVTQARDKNYIHPTSDSIISIASEYYTKSNNPDRQMLSYYYMGRVNQDLNNVTKAQEYYLKGLETGKLSEDYALIGRIHSNIGTLYTSKGTLDLAMPHLQESVACFRKTNETRNLSFVLRDIARIYTLENQLDSAVIYYRHALLYSDFQSRFSVLNGLGFIYTEKKDYQTAYYYIMESLKHIYDINDYYPIYLTLGKLFYKMGKADSARYYLFKSMDSPKLETRAGSYFFLYKLAKEKRQWETYALFQEKYETLRDSIMSQRYTFETQKLQRQYDYQQAENKATLAMLDHAIAARNNIILIFIVVVLAGSLILYYLYGLATKRRKQKMQEELFNYFLNKQDREYDEQLRVNINRINELESLLNGKTAEEKDVIQLEKKLLELENKKITRLILEKEETKKKLELSEIYYLFVNDPIHKITDKDKKTLMSLIEETYPAFKSEIFHLYPTICADDLFMCYLIKANVKGTRISQIMCLSKQAISMRRKRLAVVMLGEGSCQKSLDSLISSL